MLYRTATPEPSRATCRPFGKRLGRMGRHRAVFACRLRAEVMQQQKRASAHACRSLARQEDRLAAESLRTEQDQALKMGPGVRPHEQTSFGRLVKTVNSLEEAYGLRSTALHPRD